MAVVASAATSKTFFTKKADGYQCVGTGNIDGSEATATLKATALPLQQIIPGADCWSEVTVIALDSSGNEIGSATTKGDVEAVATYKNTTKTFSSTKSTFMFNGYDLGKYELDAG